MRLLHLIAIFLFATQVMAAPAAPVDDMERLLVEKGLLARIDQVRQTATEKASELVFTALGFMGVPYRRGGNTAETGFDCSGFVKAMYEQTVGLILPRRAEQQAASTSTPPSPAPKFASRTWACPTGAGVSMAHAESNRLLPLLNDINAP